MPPELEANPRGIPKAPFVDNVELFLTDGQVEPTLRKFQEMISKYKYMEVHLLQRQKALETKIPEIKKTLDTVDLLISQKDAEEQMETSFELTETLWASAKVPSTKTVYLWLGANVMLEYPVEEADSLLQEKYEKAKTSLQQVEEDLEFLRDQVTTMEVNTARVYNWDVKQRRTRREGPSS
ncbi:Prefoldin subunit-domain-containing protein [Cladochytrium replicatum]|nr:Prefoldin subunit-domain-containing protein [Cladochytrium replicatum]